MTEEEREWVSKAFGPKREFMDVEMTFQAPANYKKK